MCIYVCLFVCVGVGVCVKHKPDFSKPENYQVEKYNNPNE